MADLNYNDILKQIQAAIDGFNKSIPGIQNDMLDNITDQLKKLDLSGNKIKATVANLKIVNSIKNKLQNLIITDQYLDNVKQFVQAFTTISTLQNQYFTAIENSFKPRPLLQEIRNQAVTDTVNSLTENGIGANIADNITGILRTNITAGGSIKDLEKQLRDSLTDNQKSDGLLTKYTKQITTDSINQYSRQYSQVISGDLGLEWYSYANSLITTSRPFCIAMHERDYFHVSEIPALLEARGLYYTDPKTGTERKVQLGSNGLPAGMYDNENESNFLTLLGGYNCGHQARPISERLVPADVQARVKATPEYMAYKGL